MSQNRLLFETKEYSIVKEQTREGWVYSVHRRETDAMGIDYLRRIESLGSPKIGGPRALCQDSIYLFKDLIRILLDDEVYKIIEKDSEEKIDDHVNG